VGRVANLRPIANRPPDGVLDAPNILSDIFGTGRLAIGRTLENLPEIPQLVAGATGFTSMI